MIGLTIRADALDSETLASTIHDDVLQSLGVAMLSVDLCRRLHQRMRYEDALAELSNVVEAAGAALSASDVLLPDLRRLVPRATTPTRPNLVIVAAPGQPWSARPAASPNEIVQTLVACELMARRCRHQYDAGLGEDTMVELELLLQRIEFVALAFRAVMHDLRAQSRATSPVAVLARTA